MADKGASRQVPSPSGLLPVAVLPQTSKFPFAAIPLAPQLPLDDPCP